LKALAQQSVSKYEDYANKHREDSPRYEEGQRIFVDTRNMKTNRPIKKRDDKMAGPYKILKVYLRACPLELPAETKIFPVFHNSLLWPHSEAVGMHGQMDINLAESRHLRGRILE
jgi:hypothetical protein